MPLSLLLVIGSVALAQPTPAPPPGPSSTEQDEAKPTDPSGQADPEAKPTPPPSRRPAPAPAPPGRAPANPEAPFEPELEVSSGLHPLWMLGVHTLVGIGLGVPLAIVLPMAPLFVAVVVATIGDMFGQQRGTLAWPVAGGYLGILGLVFIPLIVWAIILAFGFVVGFVGLGLSQLLTMAMAPFLVMAVIGAAIVSFMIFVGPAVPVAMLLFGGVGSGVGAGVAYYFTAENKLPGDTEFRFPGVLEPSHRPDRIFVRRAPPGRSPRVTFRSPIARDAMAY